MNKTTLARLLESVFSGGEFSSKQNHIKNDQINLVLERLPFSLSKSQRDAIFRALQNDISYIQGPPGTGKSFTISALAIAGRELGLKVLVASQKTPAVDIVHKKLTDVLGKSSCLYLANSYEKRKNMRAIIQDLVSQSLDLMNQLEEREEVILSEKVNTLIEKRLDYAKKIRIYESELRNFYNLNIDAVEHRVNLQENWKIKKEIIKNINLIYDKNGIIKIKKLVKECEIIRDKAINNAGKITLSDAVKIKIIAKAILQELNFDNNEYLKHKEELLKSVITFSESLAKAEEIKRKVKVQPLQQIRDSFNWESEKIYTKEISDSILSKYLSKRNKVKVNRLLKDRKYKKALDIFCKRLSARNRRRIQAYNSEIDFNCLFEVFQIIMGEIKSLHAFLPFEEELFDLVILDEASQVNLAEIFPVLYRAKRFCIVGDHKQLGIKAAGGMFISKFYEKLTWDKYFSSLPNYPVSYKKAEERDLLVSKSSILNLIRNPSNPITAPPILLNEHFRSLPMLAEFTSEQFYKDDTQDAGLRIMTALPDKKAINAFCDIQVSTKREEGPSTLNKNTKSKLNKGEVDKSFEIIQSFARNKPIKKLTEQVFKIPDLSNGKISVGVISFTREQVRYMKSVAEKQLTDEEVESINLMIGTPEEFQGNERDVMIFAPSIDPDQKRSRGHMEDPNRFNVATSRARYFTYFVHGAIPSNMILMQKMLTKMGQERNEIVQNRSGFLPIGWTLKLSDCESEFELRIFEVLSNLIEKEFPNRLFLYNQVRTCGYRLDFVIYEKTSKSTIGIEVDGKHHFYADDISYTDDHLERANSLKRGGWIIKYLPYWDWYDDGWLPDDHPPVEELKNFVREFFNQPTQDN